MVRYLYFDNNATTRPLETVVEAMLPFLRDQYANPSSLHAFGQGVRHRIECAREQVAALIGSDAREIVLTSGGTEAIHLAVRGTLNATPDRPKLVISDVEHSAVRKLADRLKGEGRPVEAVPVDGSGRLDLDALASVLTPDTGLLSVMWANNETGVLFDIDRVAAIAHDHGVPLHVDAVQAAGKIPIDVTRVPVSLLSISGHKFHGPKGVGALYVRKRSRLEPLLTGGGQERSLRAGTENVPGIIGLGVAAEAAVREGPAEVDRIRGLRDALERGICEAVPSARVNGGQAPRIANTTNIGFAGLQAEGILLLLSERGVCASAGAACSSGSLEPSHVLQAMGVDVRYAHGSVRFSLSRFNTPDEVREVIGLMPEIVSRLTPVHSR
ncbi:MAG: aminotransferase class V-fold PLP-dependent enzyme [Phycisphaerae bacterium]|nr:aminotransferase class V-fold PLP-dependent enzyme [Phycisphaerae bacterium]